MLSEITEYLSTATSIRECCTYCEGFAKAQIRWQYIQLPNIAQFSCAKNICVASQVIPSLRLSYHFTILSRCFLQYYFIIFMITTSFETMAQLRRLLVAQLSSDGLLAEKHGNIRMEVNNARYSLMYE